jgi:3-(3-hydroxy-phenyl)propionate hydroxylase
MAIEDRVLIAGAGPVGLTAAANLVRAGVPVTVLEAGSDLSEESRASTFHPPTLDMLDRLGAAQPLIAQGLRAYPVSRQAARCWRVRFGVISDVIAHLYRCRPSNQADPHPYEQLRDKPDRGRIRQRGRGRDATSGVEIGPGIGRSETRSGRWLIGADGARSTRRALGMISTASPGRAFLVVSTPFDFSAVIPTSPR